jgi:hypothetical protein
LKGSLAGLLWARRLWHDCRPMTLPPTITLKTICPQGGDLSDIIFKVRVTSGTKNQYYIYFPKTTLNGIAGLSAEDFRGQFNDHNATFIMDYNGSVETASDLVGINLFDSKSISKNRESLSHWPLSDYEKTVWKSRQEKIEYFLSCRNEDFFFCEESVRIPQDGVIRLTVGRKISRSIQ